MALSDTHERRGSGSQTLVRLEQLEQAVGSRPGPQTFGEQVANSLPTSADLEYDPFGVSSLTRMSRPAEAPPAVATPKLSSFQPAVARTELRAEDSCDLLQIELQEASIRSRSVEAQPVRRSPCFKSPRENGPRCLESPSPAKRAQILACSCSQEQKPIPPTKASAADLLRLSLVKQAHAAPEVLPSVPVSPFPAPPPAMATTPEQQPAQPEPPRSQVSALIPSSPIPCLTSANQ